MSSDFQDKVQTEELLNLLLRKIFVEVEVRQRTECCFEIQSILSREFKMKLMQHGGPCTFSPDLKSICGWPWVIDHKQTEPFKVWSRTL